ncbi:hypothetical protein Dsin_017374 [Dipteronia sinensis]|uniref:Reverse transcriptase n=1 Tax=Dipteronia sinensis TaxID=43782 RepID=A0AAE0AFU1_9ROSI|nr:hypothetical protein Dsin_017374 [Dipteronia sinensis]
MALPRSFSDHCPLLIRLSDFEVTSSRPFRFQSMWLEHQDFITLVRSIWSSSAVGNPLPVVISKLRSLRKALKTWYWEIFGDLNSDIAEISANLQSI